jgi:hypothetical protein
MKSEAIIVAQPSYAVMAAVADPIAW